MELTDIDDANKSRKDTRTLYREMIIKHFNLNVRAANAVIPMSSGVENP